MLLFMLSLKKSPDTGYHGARILFFETIRVFSMFSMNSVVKNKKQIRFFPLGPDLSNPDLILTASEVGPMDSVQRATSC